MLEAIEICNFKSIEKLKVEFGRVNVFIGENGSGKSTLLEALTFAAAAEANKLDSEFLENRGIRVTSPKLMRSNFTDTSIEKPITIKVFLNDNKHHHRTYIMDNKNETYSEWEVETDSTIGKKDDGEPISTLEFKHIKNSMISMRNIISSESFVTLKEKFKDADLEKILLEINNNDYFNKMEVVSEKIETIEQKISNQLIRLKNFVIYSPQNKQLRNLKEEGSIRPVGIHGEGLFKLLREVYEKQPESINDIEKGLQLISWYKSLDLENEPELPEDELFIQDKFLPINITQRSANEGFLYLLFYMVLIVSKNTPKIFAIDNIDAALNPKLCAKITSYIVELAKKYDKQIFLTTQNPATLDGINILDDEQKILVVSRKKRGQTSIREFTADKMPRKENGEKLMLSEAMIKGYIGGIPKGF